MLAIITTTFTMLAILVCAQYTLWCGLYRANDKHRPTKQRLDGAALAVIALYVTTVWMMLLHAIAQHFDVLP